MSGDGDNGRKYVIRGFLPEDGPAVIDIVNASYRDLNYTMDFDEFDADLADIPATYRDAGGEFWVLDHGGEPVGVIGAVPRDAETCELKRLYLRSRHRGKGLGGLLLENAIAWSRGKGFRRAVLWSDVLFETARQVYMRYGFRPTERTRAVDPTNPTSIERYFVKDL